MEENVTTQTTDTLAGECKSVKIGKLTFKVKPLCLFQIYEIGELVKNMMKNEADDNQTLLAYTMSNHNDARLYNEIAVKALLKSKTKRALLGWYIKKNLNSEAFKAVFEVVRDAFDYAFFLQSTIFLKGTFKTEKKKETKVTARGDSWVES